MIINLFDISKFFDKEDICDVLGEAHAGGLKGKKYRLIYELNKDAIIKVKTSLGETKEAEIDPGLGQGGAESGILSAVSLDGGVQDYFRDSNHVYYDNIPIKALLWQDDVLKVNNTLKEAQECNLRMEAVLASKNLSFNLDKSVFLVAGNKRFKEKVSNQLEESPLLLCDKKMKNVENYSYLGEVLSDVSVGHSVLSTINKRYGIAHKAIFEIKMIMEDTRSTVPGAFMLANKIWEIAVLPALLYSSDIWIEMPKAAIEKLDKLQNKFYQILLNCPSTCPKPGLYWFTGGMLMTNRVMKENYSFYTI